MRHVAQTAFLFVILALCAGNVYPCSCAGTSAREDFRRARAIFIGEATDISKGDLPATIKFKVEKQWKGPKQSELLASWGFEGVGTCGGFLFETGEKYLVYAYGKELSVYTACDRTRKLEYATDDLKKLNSFWFRFFGRVYPF